MNLKVSILDCYYEVDDAYSPEYWRDISNGSWEPHTFKIVNHFVSKDDVVLDLGAWAGPIGLFAAAKGAVVHSFEPDHVLYQELEKNIQINQKNEFKIKAHHAAMTVSDGEFTLNARHSYGIGSSSLLDRVRDKNADQKVKGITLKSFLEKESIQNLSFVKMDIEGGEFLLFPSIVEQLRSAGNPTLLLSLHIDHLNESIYRQKKWSGFLAKAMMKLENLTGYFYRRKLLKEVNKISALQNNYDFIYLTDGTRLNNIDPKMIIKQKPDMLFSNQPYTQ